MNALIILYIICVATFVLLMWRFLHDEAYWAAVTRQGLMLEALDQQEKSKKVKRWRKRGKAATQKQVALPRHKH
jgi:hypothetical protein